ncbi:MAG: glycosyltransferase family 2 protein [Chitinophagaceae bacterium]
MNKNKIAAIVVTFNRLNHLKNVVQCIREQTDISCDIVVIDNGSTDETPAWLTSTENSDLIVFSQENIGGAGGFNRGVKEVYHLGYEYFWLMDDDVYPEKNALYELMNASSKLDNKYGFLASMVRGINGNPVNIPGISKGMNPNTGYADWLDNIEDIGIKLESATFVSIVMNRHVISQIGLPIKDLFIWYDDSEYTLRAAKIYPGYLVASSLVYHKRGIEKTITIQNEENPNRIKMHFYSIRNAIFLVKVTSKSFGMRFIRISWFISRNMVEILHWKTKYKGLKLKILFRAASKGIWFNPKIESIS